ncbi:MAG: hypothetical protein IPL95_16665 [Saprospiraceae bacterium]|nr:hypothetical protein [Saprospiraceae bacterium]
MLQKIGMRYVDKTIEKGKYYLYTLQIKNLNDKYYCKSKLSMNVDRLPKIIPSGLDEQEKYIRITWSKKQIENKFTGFYLQKSKDGIQYYPINKDKLIIGAHTKDFKMEDYVFLIV